MRRDIKVIVFVLLALMIASVPIIGGKEFFEEAKLLSNSKQINSVNPIKEHKESSEAMEEPPVDINDNKAETVTKTKETEEIPKTYEENETFKNNDISVDEVQTQNRENKETCSLIVSCKSVLDNMGKLKKGKKDIVPQNGLFLYEVDITFNDGETAFDILERKLKDKNISIDYVKTPVYNSIYIRGIGNLCEFDCGDMSGWLYKVNGEKPSYSSSQYEVKCNDKIEFYFSCNYLKD